MNTISVARKSVAVEDRLWADFGPLMDTKSLCKVLHFRSANALHVAHLQGRLPFAVFNLEGRRGLFAWTLDVAGWLETSANCALSREATGSGVSKDV